MGLGAHGCPEHRSDARRREPLSGLVEGKRAGSLGHQKAQKVCSWMPTWPRYSQAWPLALRKYIFCPRCLLSILLMRFPLQDLPVLLISGVTFTPRTSRLASLCISGANASLVEQKPRWALVRRGQAETLRCFLRDAQYPYMSWYQQDLQGNSRCWPVCGFLGTRRSYPFLEQITRPPGSVTWS